MTTGIISRERAEEEKANIDDQFKKLLSRSLQMDFQEFKKQLKEIDERINRLDKQKEQINNFFKAS